MNKCTKSFRTKRIYSVGISINNVLKGKLRVRDRLPYISIQYAEHLYIILSFKYYFQAEESRVI